MMKKIRHSSSIVVATLLIGGMFILTGMEVYGQEQPQQQPASPSTSPSTDETTEWMTSFNLENCDFASTGENSYFILKPGYQVTLEGEEDGEDLRASNDCFE